MGEYSCRICSKTFSRNSSLRRHVKQFHASTELPPRCRVGRKPSAASRKRTCRTCGNSFSSRQSLANHKRMKHRESVAVPRRSDVQKMEFCDTTAFMEWKRHLELKTLTTFVKARKDSKISNYIRHSYYCSRSGRKRTAGRGIRHSRVQGSCKIGSFCPAAIFVRIAETGTIHVSYYSDHVGHDHDVAHQQLSYEQRSQIAGMLAIGIPFDDVLDRVQSSGDNAAVSRLHLVTKQDLKNIVRDFNLCKGVRIASNDADSVAAWIEQQRADGEQCMVRYVKFQGAVDDERGLRDDDFMLVIISEAQLSTLQKLYKPNSEVALDSTHGTNGYDYQLTTLMLIDEHGEGFPAAFCFSNRVDELAMVTFLSVCKENIGWPLLGAILMTDDAEVYFNAWSQVMGQPAVRLLCTWHIDRAWRKNMSKIKGDSTLKATVYKTLRALLEISDKEIFAQKLTEFMETAAGDARTALFAEYFRKEYASRPEVWAFCYRLGLKVHHNMHLEALHRVLKHVFMSGRKVRRMDNCIHALLRLMRTKMHDRLLKVHKGKWTRHLLGIRNRHKKGLNLDPSVVTVVQPNTAYAVRGRNTDTYLVEQTTTVPHDSLLCPLSCQPCNVCIHTFSCTCVDFGLRNTVCKHIHAVVNICQPVITCKPEKNTCQTSADIAQVTAPLQSNIDCVADENILSASEEIISVTTRSVQLDETTVILESIASQNPAEDLQHYISVAENYWSSIRTDISNNVELASAACEKLAGLKAYISALKCKPQLAPLTQQREPANKKVVQQHRFFSTKRTTKKRKPEATMSKPDDKEKAALLESLSGNVEVVFTSEVDTDHDYHVGTGDRIAFEHSY